ncbi:hypothetical protein [Thiobacillus sp.]|uniref:hypothetical protein n=1 Tax=Thiobacillus sp. TaxID=924 RepID=UPI00286DB7F8|nr:hypothetical protein [Thiobacillus sp.]
MQKHPQPRLAFKLLSALAAFVLWGGWAYYINGGNANPASLTAAGVQGSASFIITLLMVRAITWLHGRVPSGTRQVWLPSVITLSSTGSILIAAHWLAGTPQILPTIAPALLVGGLFCLFTSHTLLQSETQHGQAG